MSTWGRPRDCNGKRLATFAGLPPPADNALTQFARHVDVKWGDRRGNGKRLPPV
jgi:hypothetical protein